MDDAHFWSYVKCRGDDECWPWVGGRDQDGYGVYRIPRSKQVRAHRYAYRLGVSEELPTFVCHTCDHPPCCNPRHLFPGDAASNCADMVAKGRRAGLRNFHRLSAELHDEIRARYRGGDGSYRTLAAEYDVTPSCIQYVVARCPGAR